MRESRTYGSVRGALSNERPYRDRRFVPADFHFGSHEPKARRGSNVCWDDRLLRGCPRTFGPFHRGVVTTDALQVGAARDGDNSGHSLSAFRAARYLIHETLPNFHP